MKSHDFVRNLITTTRVPDNLRETLEREFEKKKKKGNVESFVKRGIKREKKKVTDQLKFLKDVLAYLETNPREKFVTQQLEKLKARETAINNGFNDWVHSAGASENKDKTTSQLKSIYRKEMDLKKIEHQIKFLIFILK